MNFDENEPEPLTTPDTENHTRINADEGRDPKQDYGPGGYWERLSRINTGAANSFGKRNETVARRQERLVAWDTMGDNLQLTSYQKRRGRMLMEDLKVGGSGGLGANLSLAAFALAAYVVYNDDLAERAYHPRRSNHRNCSRFLHVANDFDFRPGRVHSVMNKIPHHVDEY